MYPNTKRGFTLLELLVVISIIALLTLGILAALDQARAKGRDAERISDVKQIHVALELYYAVNKKYPDPSTLEDDLVDGGHINALPTDPKTGDPYLYETENSGKDFKIQVTADDGKTCELRSTSTVSFGSTVCPDFN